MRSHPAGADESVPDGLPLFRLCTWARCTRRAGRSSLVLAFGPFVVLGVVVAVRRRQDRREAQAAEAQRDR